jgi:hypothetical protein
MTLTLRGCSPAQRSDVGTVDSSSSAGQPPPLPLAPVLAARLARQAEASGEDDRGKRKVVEAGVTTRPPTARKFMLSKKAREALELSDSEEEKRPAATQHDRAPDEQMHSKVCAFPLVPQTCLCWWLLKAVRPLTQHAFRFTRNEKEILKAMYAKDANTPSRAEGTRLAAEFTRVRSRCDQKPSDGFFSSRVLN